MATGTIVVKDPNGKRGTFRVISIDSNDECPSEMDCINKEITYVDPKGNSGVEQGKNAIGRIVDAGGSGVFIVIELQPRA